MFDAAISLLEGAIIGIRGHAPAGDKKEKNLREMSAAIKVLRAADKFAKSIQKSNQMDSAPTPKSRGD